MKFYYTDNQHIYDMDTCRTMFDTLISHPIRPLSSLSVDFCVLDVSHVCDLLRVHPLLNELELGEWSDDQIESLHDIIWAIRPDIQMKWRES